MWRASVTMTFQRKRVFIPADGDGILMAQCLLPERVEGLSSHCMPGGKYANKPQFKRQVLKQYAAEDLIVVYLYNRNFKGIAQDPIKCKTTPSATGMFKTQTDT